MLDKIEPRQIFMALSFGVFASSPFFVLLLPSFIANALYQAPNSWVIVVPAKVYVLYGLGMLFLFIATFLLWALSVNKKSKWLAAICVLISILLLADGSGLYVGGRRMAFHLNGGWCRRISTMRGIKFSRSFIASFR